MAVAYISEYGPELAFSNGRSIPAGLEPAAAEQHIAIGGTSTAGAAFGSDTRWVRVHVDAICSVAFGVTPTAVATVKRMAANSTEFFQVRPGDTIAVITNT